MRLISFLNGNRSGRGVETAAGITNPLPVATSTNLRVVTATIASGASASSVVSLNPGERIVGIIMPAAWTTANVTIQASYDGINYLPVISYGAAIQMFPSASFFTTIDARTILRRIRGMSSRNHWLVERLRTNMLK